MKSKFFRLPTAYCLLLLLAATLPAAAQSPSPSPLYICEGSGFSLHSTASAPSGQASVTFTWVQVEAPISGTTAATLTTKSGPGNHTLTMTAAEITEGAGTYVYSCFPANDDCSDLTSGEYTVVVLKDSKPVIKPTRDVYCPNESYVVFFIDNYWGDDSGETPAATYTWYAVTGGPGTPTDSDDPPLKDFLFHMPAGSLGTRTAKVQSKIYYTAADKTCIVMSDEASAVVDGTDALRVEQSGKTTFCPGEQATFSVKVYDGTQEVEITGGGDASVEWYANENDTQELPGSSHYSLTWTTPDIQPLSSTETTISIWVRAHSRFARPCASPMTEITLTRGLKVGSISGCVCGEGTCACP
jgi:hypothetical protein